MTDDEMREELAFARQCAIENNDEKMKAWQENANLRTEVEHLREYKKHIYDYVQCTGNTSPKTLGYHVAEALVTDHKELKHKLSTVREALEDIFKHLNNYAVSQHEALCLIRRDCKNALTALEEK